MKVIIGTGQLGLAILDVLLAANPAEELMLVNRSGKLTQKIPANVQLVAADAMNKHEMACIFGDADVVYSCTDVPYQLWAGFYPAMASALAYALSKTDARLVYADNMYSYGKVAGKVMLETMPANALTKKGKVRADVIEALLYPGGDVNPSVAIVKAADFIGPRIYKGVFGKDFLSRLYAEKPVYLFGDPDLPHTFTYINDFAQAMVNIGDAADAFGQIWHAPNAPAISTKAWISFFEECSGKKVKVKQLPKLVIRVAGIFNVLMRELYELAYQFEYPYLVSHHKYAGRFGNHFTTYRAVAMETISWYLASGEK